MNDNLKSPPMHQNTLRMNRHASEETPADTPFARSKFSSQKDLRNDVLIKFDDTALETKEQPAQSNSVRKSKFFSKEEFFESKGGATDSAQNNATEQKDLEPELIEEQHKARQVLQLIKRGVKNKDFNRRDGFSSDKLGISSGSRISLDPQWTLAHSALEEEKKREQKEADEQNKIKIDNPNSMLHIAHYTQNKQIFDFVKVEHEEDGSYLKMNVPDCQTFFRLQHELYEINRKKQDFEEMKAKIFDKKDREELLEYDKRLKTVVGIQSQTAEELATLKGSKNYQKGVRIAKKIVKPPVEKRKSLLPNRINSIVDALNERKRDARLNVVEINEN